MRLPRLLSMAITTLLLCVDPAVAVLVFDNGTANVVDTVVNDFIEIEDSAGGSPTTVTFNTGAVITGTDSFDDTVFTEDFSRAIINDGIFVNDVSAYDQSRIIVRGGIFSDDLYAEDFARISFEGGTLADDVEAVDSSTIFIRGGSIGEDIEADGATIDISGGELAANGLDELDFGISAADGGLIILRGSDFSIDGDPVDFGFVSEVFGEISGTLADGSTFVDIPFDRDPFFFGGPGFIQLVAVPEASSVMCGTLVTALLLSRHRRRDEAE